MEHMQHMHSRLPVFSLDEYDLWKIRMQAHLSSIHDDMWTIIEEGPFIFEKDNLPEEIAVGKPAKIPKKRTEMTSEERKLVNLYNRARDILYQTLDKATMVNIKNCKHAKEIWDTLAVMCEGTELIKENKLTIATQKFDNFKMKTGESIDQVDARFTEIVNEINSLGKTYGNREMALKVLRSLNLEWSMKVVAMRESKDLNKIKIQELFSDLKAYEFELPSTSSTEPAEKGIAFAADSSQSLSEANPPSPLNFEEEMAFIMQRFSNFKNNYSKYRKNFKENPKKHQRAGNWKVECFNCHKIGHIQIDCPELKKNDDRREHVGK
ncbi:hypothetical protein OROHE_013070 [Orobanche hederae]